MVAGVLGINHQSPLIYCVGPGLALVAAGNQSPIPFDILLAGLGDEDPGWESITNPL